MVDYKNVKMIIVESKFKIKFDRISMNEFCRYSELDRLSREKDIKIEQLKESYQELEDKWQNATDQCLQLRQQQNEKQREHEQIIRDKDAQQSA